MSGFNYSKWDNIELSDDESDLHPNIDKESWFRMKHRSRLEREEQEDKEMVEIKKAESEARSRHKIIKARLQAIEDGTAGEEAEFEDVEALKSESAEIQGHLDMMANRVNDITERRKWNIDNICKVKDERTMISSADTKKSLKGDDFAPTGITEATIAKNKSEKEKDENEKPSKSSAETKADTSKPDAASAAVNTTTSSKPAAAPAHAAVGPQVDQVKEKKSILSYNDYVLTHEDILETYSEIHDLEKTKDYLWKHCDILMHEHSQSYMLLSSLEDEMNGKRERMKLVCRQSQILSHVQELGVSMGRDPRDVILAFFERIGEKTYLNNFLEAVKGFEQRIIERAVVKRKEMDAERLEEEGVPLGPGGLNPFEVLNEMPQVLRDAFDSQEVSRLSEALSTMKPEDAKFWMKKCVDSGLWVAGPNDGADDDEEAARKARELDPLD